MYQRILVAIDGSPVADKALAEAIMLARVGGGRLLILHVSEPPLPVTGEGQWVMMDLPRDLFLKMGEELLAKAAEKAQAGNVAVETRLVEALGGRVARFVVEAAADWQADLIVAGSHGRRGIDRLLLGSVAEGLVRMAHVPALLVRGDGHPDR